MSACGSASCGRLAGSSSLPSLWCSACKWSSRRACLLQGGALPVTFTAAKSALGHAEAGAGVLGMLHAAARLRQRVAQPLTHLRALNSHVASILQASKSPASLPSQAAPGLTGARDAHIGISSFAFQVRTSHQSSPTWQPFFPAQGIHRSSAACCCSKPRAKHLVWLGCMRDNALFRILLQGTNAHVILCMEPPVLPEPAAAVQQQQPWRRRRFWHGPEPHALLHSCVASPDEDCVRAHMRLDRPATAFLQDFQAGTPAYCLPVCMHASVCLTVMMPCSAFLL